MNDIIYPHIHTLAITGFEPFGFFFIEVKADGVELTDFKSDILQYGHSKIGNTYMFTADFVEDQRLSFDTRIAR